MRTVRTKVYKFNELVVDAQQNAIEQKRENVNTDFIYDDAHETVKAFNELFNLPEGSRSWLDCNTSKIDDSILELKGLRLQKYIMNNYASSLFKKAHLKAGKNRKDKPGFYHPMTKVTQINQGSNKGLYYVSYYSNWKTESLCVLTGMCYDNNILDPIYNFLEKRDFTNCTITFYDLLNDCFDEMTKTVENEVEYRNTDEAIIEDIEANDYEYTKNGQLFF